MRRTWNRLKARLAPSDPDRIDLFLSAPFLMIHLSLAAVPWLGFGPREAAVAAATYVAGMFFVTAGYHRYFSHRAFRAGRIVQLVLAVGAQCTVQRGVLWWAGHHRAHHRFSDGPRDPHAAPRGLAWSHVGWFLASRHETAPLDRVRDLARFRELVWLERWYWVPSLALGLAIAAAGGLRLAVGGYLLGIVVLWHATFTINSLAHRWGTRPYPTRDGSRNNALLALLTFGEGWHNNHHHAPSSARQGFRWWQLDLTWLALVLLERIGVVRDLRPGPLDRRARPAPATAPARAAAATLAALVLVLPPPARGDAERVERFTGTARGADGAVLYREEHEVILAGDRPLSAVTVYLDPSGRRIAGLRTDFSADPFAPPYVFEDLRSGAAESVARSPEGLVVRAGTRSRALKLAPEEARRVVAGQGLDRLVRARLDELARGESLVLSYVIPSRLDAYELRVRAAGASGAERVRVRVEFSSWLLRLLAPALEVDYDPATRRLLRYRGPSNLADDRGENPDVEITYAYPEEAGATAGAFHGST